MPFKSVFKININRWFPFLNWYGELKHWPTLRSDIIAGLTVAMLLIPQSLAYAQVAGLPAYYGLYAAFLPPIIGALFGSSRSLSTGPVAITSLLTGSALQSLAVSGSEGYLQYVMLLTLSAGIIQLLFGLLRMGLVVNLISFPVLTGFTNAAVLIIAASQIPNLMGIHIIHSGPIYETFLTAMREMPNLIHWPSLGIGLLAFAIMMACSRWFPRLPQVLMAVIVTTIIAWLFNFEKTRTIEVTQIINPSVQEIMQNHLSYPRELHDLLAKIQKAEMGVQKTIAEQGEEADITAKKMNELSQLQWQLERRITREKLDQEHLSRIRLRTVNRDNKKFFFVEGQMTPLGEAGSLLWRISDLRDGKVFLHAGGEVIGEIPKGLPKFTLISLDWFAIQRLLIAALAVALVGFMESIAVAKQIATDSREQLDVNLELRGQGLAKIGGAFFQSIPVSGGFSRSVLNFYSGAKTGFSSVVSGLAVMLVLLWFTPLFYYLPISTLAAVIMYTIFKLLNLKAISRAFRINLNEGWVALLTFIMTLLLAPRIEIAVILGVLMSLIVYLNDTMRPKFTEIIRNEKGELVDADNTTQDDRYCYLISLIRVGGSLYFANASYFEERILQLITRRPKLRYIIVDCVSINKIDASGLEALVKVAEHLEEAGIELWFTRVRSPVMSVLKRGELAQRLGKDRFYKNNAEALTRLSEYLGPKHVNQCPLLIPTHSSPKNKI